VTDSTTHDVDAPPAGEELHLPGPTIVPFLNAVGLALILVGLTTWWVYSAIGAVLFLWTTVRWIADTRRDVAALPLEH
jgi:hypothetical protein